MDIEKFIEKKIPGLNVLRLSSSTYLPGAIIDTKENDLRWGHAKDIFKDVPKLTDQQKCIHCGENFIVGDYKVELVGKIEYIVCPNAPDCDGTLIDWINVR